MYIVPSLYNLHDFTVKFNNDPSETVENIFERIFFTNRLKENKPCILLLTGESGEGKSTTAFNILDNYYRKKGIDFVKVLPYITIFNPGQFYDTINLVLRPPKEHPDYKLLKKINTLLIDEASEVVGSSHWQSIVNENIRRINAISRGIKPLFIIWITPFTREIELKTRTTIQFHGICTRPLKQHATMELRKIVKNERDFEKPKIETRKIKGYILMPNGQYVLDYPKFEFYMPRKEIMEKYSELELLNKTNLIENKLAKLADWFTKESKGQLDRVEAIVSHYVKHPDEMTKIAEKKRGGWKILPEVQYMFNLNRDEVHKMQKRLTDELTREGSAIAATISI